MAPRVLVDATAVPADRGASAATWTAWWSPSAARGPTSRWPARRTTRSGTGGWCRTPRSWPARPRSRTGPPGWPGSRPGCRWWPSRSRRRPALAALHMPLRRRRARSWSPCTTRRSSPTRTCITTVSATFFRRAIRTSLRRAAGCIVPSQGHPRRAGAGARRRPDPDRRRLPRRRPAAVPRRRARAAAARVCRPARAGTASYVAFLGALGAAQERPGADPRLGRGGAERGQPAGAGARRRQRLGRATSTRRSARSRRTCA